VFIIYRRYQEIDAKASFKKLLKWTIPYIVVSVQDSELFIYKDKKSPEFVIALNDAEIRTDPRKENKFIVTSSTHKVYISSPS
jgi:hypothetical protein